MQELVFVAVWFTAATFTGLQVFLYKGGVAASAAALAMWAAVYFGSTAVETVSSGVVIEVSNPMVQWIAVFMLVVQFVVFLFVLAGVGPWAEEQPADEGLAGAAGDIQDQI